MSKRNTKSTHSKENALGGRCSQWTDTLGGRAQDFSLQSIENFESWGSGLSQSQGDLEGEQVMMLKEKLLETHGKLLEEL